MMIDGLYAWVRMLLISMLCIQLILLFITQEAYAAYIRMYLHMLFILLVFRPLLTVGNLDELLVRKMEQFIGGWETELSAQNELPAANAFRETAQTAIADADKTMYENAIRQSMNEDIAMLLEAEKLKLLRLTCTISWEKEKPAVSQILLEALWENGQTEPLAELTETVKNRLKKRYALNDAQVKVTIHSG